MSYNMHYLSILLKLFEYSIVELKKIRNINYDMYCSLNKIWDVEHTLSVPYDVCHAVMYALKPKSFLRLEINFCLFLWY